MIRIKLKNVRKDEKVKGKEKQMKKSVEFVKGKIKKRWIIFKIYRWNIICLLIMVGLLLAVNLLDKPMKTNYEQYSGGNIQIEPETLRNVDYYYYLDFSPSMSGFFDERVNAEMSALAETLESINDSVRSRTYYRCTNVIEGIDDVTFYDSMRRLDGYTDYYDTIVKRYEDDLNGENIIETVEGIDLGKIFYETYQDGGKYAAEKDSIKIIVTDLAFNRSEQEVTEETDELLNEFINELARKNTDSNIGIYQIQGAFMGYESDEYIPLKDTVLNVQMKKFYIMVMSENGTVYSDFTDQLEMKMLQNNVDCSEKYELLNQVLGRNFELTMDESSLITMGFADNQTLNLDKKSFEELKGNEIALRVIKNEEKNNVMLDAVTSLGRKSQVSQTDKMEVAVKPKISYMTKNGKYEEYTEGDFIRHLSAGTEWRSDGEYLKFSFEINPYVFDDIYKKPKVLNIAGRNCYVLELKFFIEQPSFILPEWIAERSVDLENLSTALKKIAEVKKKAYRELDEEQRYLGSIVIYLTY